MLISNYAIRESMNAALVPLTIFLLVAIGDCLLRVYRELGPGWSRYPGIQTACALWWIFLAAGMRSFQAWLQLRSQIRGGAVLPEDPAAIGYTFAGVIMVGAMLRCLYLFTPRSIGHWGWVLSALFSAAFAIVARSI